MIFSKSFGYALRSVLYVAATGETHTRVPLNEVAEKLNIPRHFLGKVLKRLVREGVLSSQKGPSGGFMINDRTLQTPLIKLITITGEKEQFESCVLGLRKCNARNPCPLHPRAAFLKEQWLDLFSTTTIRHLLNKNQPGFIESITVI